MTTYNIHRDDNFSEEREYMVLPQGPTLTRGYIGDYLNASLRTLAFWDIEENKLVTKSKYHMFLLWNIDDDEDKEYTKRFIEGKVYKIRAKKWLGTNPFPGMPADLVALYVTTVIEEDAHCSELECIWEEFTRPITIQHDILGTLYLDKELYMFSGKVPFGKDTISISIFVIEGREKSWGKSIDIMTKIIDSIEEQNKIAKELVANKLCKLACEYNDGTMHKEEMIQRIKLTGITLNNSQIEIEYDDDNIFGGYYLVVEGTVKAGLKKAYITG